MFLSVMTSPLSVRTVVSRLVVELVVEDVLVSVVAEASSPE